MLRLFGGVMFYENLFIKGTTLKAYKKALCMVWYGRPFELSWDCPWRGDWREVAPKMDVSLPGQARVRQLISNGDNSLLTKGALGSGLSEVGTRSKRYMLGEWIVCEPETRDDQPCVGLTTALDLSRLLTSPASKTRGSGFASLLCGYRSFSFNFL